MPTSPALGAADEEFMTKRLTRQSQGRDVARSSPDGYCNAPLPSHVSQAKTICPHLFRAAMCFKKTR